MTAKKSKISPSNSWQNRPRPVVFGDSLADIGNAVDPLTGQSLRQSDGLVLVEALLEDFGIAADSSIPSFFGAPPTGFKSPLNYAFVGATTGEDGSEAIGLGGEPIGLLAQVERFRVANNEKNAKKDRMEQDAVIAAGANDLFEFLDRVARGTANPTDPATITGLIQTITMNTIQAARSLDDLFDDVVILPSPPLRTTPLLQGFESRFPGIGNLADFIAGNVYAGLKKEFDTGERATDDVFVVDSFRVFGESISAYAADQGGTAGFWFNLVHPSSLANENYLSDRIAAQLIAESSVHPGFSFA